MDELSKKKGRIINIQHFCMDDGPGIRSTIFLKGCPLRCVWCHNPESQSYKQELLYRKERCRKCGACVSECPMRLHTMEAEHVFRRTGCLECGRCNEACMSGALEIVGQDISVQEILSELLSERIFYEQSGGGVTVSGGEPMMQPEFTKALLRACKKEGLHTCMETCGYGSQDVILDLLKYTDLFLFDYKATNDEKHQKYTGVSNRQILKNLEAICGGGAEVILRCPMIPDINVEPEHAQGIAEIAMKYKNIKEIHLEPYHPLGVGKAEALGRTAAYARSSFLEKEELEEIRQIIQEKVLISVKIV